MRRSRSYRYAPNLDGDVAGTYENSLAQITIEIVDGNATAQYTLRPEAAAEMSIDTPVFAPCTVEFLHFYTQIIGSRVFFEVVQRLGGYAGYGASNAPIRMAAHRRSRLSRDGKYAAKASGW